MTALKEIGEIGISDSREGGADYIFRPSFLAMTRIGEPDEIVKVFGLIHGSETQSIIDLIADNPSFNTSMFVPSLNRAADHLVSESVRVLQSCCDSDITCLTGEWCGDGDRVVYLPGLMPKSDIIVLAQQLMQHGIIGKAKVRKLQRNETNEATKEFRAIEYIVAAQTHFGISEEEASRLTMTKFQLLLAAKYPDQKGFTREEYDKVADDFLARQAARRARAEAARKN
ncbi:TPA: DUF6246 family protein [Citrobacter amalonaticus]|uniref:DUF6246 family protein n=1 Tax=Citrobacter amalonaticus TaxID=35703 RepID=UPI0006227A0F|nr:DUF6246 family protein [Citrobacter amalonaticus]EJE0575605.1 hypothetical protein [Escherichia coli]KKF70245.1 hypothetical protein XU19_06220 [Vibrio parahaemolyticus]KKY41784.1 hypothetical protein AAY51_12520 [Vibrio parahaemolyticus]KOP93397.1 hypothetical protein ALC61_21050 [Citrobacter amalonaticus]KOP93891.1 hypothetical protein AL012_17790 [Citrobacter amalonaticus]